MTKFEIALAVWGVINAASRGLSDEQWAKLPAWAQTLIGVIRALGPDPVKAFRKATGG